MRFWEFNSAGALLSLCALVFAWQITVAVVLGILALVLDGLPPLLQVADIIAIVLPAVYTTVAVIAFLGRGRGHW
jgi:hypothetical protein